MSSMIGWQAKLGLILLWGITILTPLVIAPTSLTYESNRGWQVDYMYMFIFGAYFPIGSGSQSGWLIGSMYVFYAIMFLLFFVIYALQVTIYCLKPITQRWVIFTGLLSLIIPFLLVGMSFPFDAYIGGVYAGSLPFQFILGLAVMRVVRAGIKSPKDKLLEEKTSWWEENKGITLTNEEVEKQESEEGKASLFGN